MTEFASSGVAGTDAAKKSAPTSIPVDCAVCCRLESSRHFSATESVRNAFSATARVCHDHFWNLQICRCPSSIALVAVIKVK